MTDSDRDVFQAALSDFTFEAACGGAIRHLADSGCTAKQIMEKLDYPISGERVRKALYKHLCDTGVILERSPEEGLPEAKPEYVLEYDSYGKPSYRKKNITGAGENRTDSGSAGAVWTEIIYKPIIGFPQPVSEGTQGRAHGSFGWGRRKTTAGNSGQGDPEKSTVHRGRGAGLSAFLTGCCDKERDGRIYISCDFGIPGSAAAKGISLLNGRQQEYLEGILWPRYRVYHRLDHRMKEILCSLYDQDAYEGICYLISRREKLYIRERSFT